MADGPCGEDFKAAFSCFVYSEAEPKGVDCVEKFRAMQDCFRLHPDIYGEGTFRSLRPLPSYLAQILLICVYLIWEEFRTASIGS